MRFIDDNIKLIINNLHFKAYLEESETMFETKDQTLPFAPLSFTNDSIATRLTEKARFKFNVFSESRGECIQNFNNLLALIKSVKPSYQIVEDQYVPFTSNVTGFVDLFFSGMPLRDNVKLHLNNFSYNINKDLGYIQVPRAEIANFENASFYEPGQMKLIPLAYSINMEGKVLIPFEQTATVYGQRIKGSSTQMRQILGKVGGDKAYQDAIFSLVKVMTGHSIYEYSSTDAEKVLMLVKAAKDNYLIDVNTGAYLSGRNNDGSKVEDLLIKAVNNPAYEGSDEQKEDVALQSAQEENRYDRYTSIVNELKGIKTVSSQESN